MLVYIVQRRGDDRKVSHRETIGRQRTVGSVLLVQVAGLQYAKLLESFSAGFEAAAMASVIDATMMQG